MLDILTVVPLSLIVELGALFRRVLYEKKNQIYFSQRLRNLKSGGSLFNPSSVICMWVRIIRLVKRIQLEQCSCWTGSICPIIYQLHGVLKTT
jgi:hypothetical protein